jgi:hypothetical protein
VLWEGRAKALTMDEDGPEGEMAFARLCDKWRCEYLHIGQSLKQQSSEMFRNYVKRPDFLVNISNVAAIFVEVKVRQIQPIPITLNGIEKQLQGYKEDHAKFIRTRNLQEKMRISTWYAFIEKTRVGIDKEMAYLIPVSRMEKWIPRDKERDTTNWPYVAAPRQCMNKCDKTIDLSDRCFGCTPMICRKQD